MTALESGGFVAEASSAWLAILVDAALKGLVVLILAIVAAWRMSNAPAAARHLVWLLAISALLLLPVLCAVLPDWECIPAGTLPPIPTSERVAAGRTAPTHGQERPTQKPSENLLTAQQGAEAAMDSSRIEAANGIASAGPSLATDASSATSYPWQIWAALAWFVGAVISMTPWVLGTVSLRRVGRSADIVTGGPLVNALSGAAKEMGIRRRVILLSSRTRRIPMQWGILRPRLLIPMEALDWPDDRLRIVLLHEMAHVRRDDCAAQLMAHLASAVYWFNPLVWVARRKMQTEAEAACDDMVLGAGCKSADYARHLVEIASNLSPGGLAGYVAIAISRSVQLEDRVRAILDRRRSRGVPTRRTVAKALVGVLAAIVPLAMLRAAVETAPPAAVSTVAPAAAQEAQRPTAGAVQPGQDAGDAARDRQPVARQAMEAQRVREVIARGVGFLKRQQKIDGGWADYASQKGGVTALCALALVRSGVAVNEQSIQNAIEYLQLQETDRTYSVALQTMFLSAADPKAHTKAIRRNVQWLEQAQRNGGWSYDIRGGETDHSNTHFALMALDAADKAGVPVESKTWRASLGHWIKVQNADGSWGYKAAVSGTGSMTCAGISSVAVSAARIAKDDDLASQARTAIERADQWMSRNFAVDKNPGSPINIWGFYYLHALTRAGHDAQRSKIGGRDWHRELSAFLTKAQRGPEGAWRGKGPIETQPLIATSLAILSLTAESKAEAIPEQPRP